MAESTVERTVDGLVADRRAAVHRHLDSRSTVLPFPRDWSSRKRPPAVRWRRGAVREAGGRLRRSSRIIMSGWRMLGQKGVESSHPGNDDTCSEVHSHAGLAPGGCRVSCAYRPNPRSHHSDLAAGTVAAAAADGVYRLPARLAGRRMVAALDRSSRRVARPRAGNRQTPRTGHAAGSERQRLGQVSPLPGRGWPSRATRLFHQPTGRCTNRTV
jgi:hypothetical protein